MLNVLFLCTHNSARSILSEALLNHLDRRSPARRFQAWSAGSSPRPGQQPHPLALEVLQSAGISIEGLRSKNWDEFAAPGAPHMDLPSRFSTRPCAAAAACAAPTWTRTSSTSRPMPTGRARTAPSIERFNLAQQPMDFAENARSRLPGALGARRRCRWCWWTARSPWRAATPPRRPGALGWPGRAGRRQGRCRPVLFGWLLRLRRRASARHFPQGCHELSRPSRRAFLFFTGKGGVGKTSLACATACNWRARAARAAGEHRSGLQCGAGVRHRDRQPHHARAAVPGLAALEIDPQAAAQAYRDRIVGPVRGAAAGCGGARASRSSSRAPAPPRSPPSTNSPRC
jgi:hypothetical protein